MSSHVKKSRAPTDEAQLSNLHKEAGEEKLNEILKNVSFKTMTLEERRKEAQKPLFLIRYE
jgi:hypothetical protein